MSINIRVTNKRKDTESWNHSTWVNAITHWSFVPALACFSLVYILLSSEIRMDMILVRIFIFLRFACFLLCYSIWFDKHRDFIEYYDPFGRDKAGGSVLANERSHNMIKYHSLLYYSGFDVKNMYFIHFIMNLTLYTLRVVSWPFFPIQEIGQLTAGFDMVDRQT